ncbi:MAG TPA: nuclear transport factor 2 family protein [Acidimicrobiales bacterium]|nr:nuclear transport factor 2 family protein [Acidimicrobiales bacterium]
MLGVENLDERAARQDVGEVLVRYASGIDRRDWGLFRSCFTDDCHAEYGGIGTWDGVESITSFMVEAHAGAGHTLHRMTNIEVELELDVEGGVGAGGQRARAHSYVDVLVMAPDGVHGVNAAGFYDDELVRTAEGWRIASRRFTMVRTQALGR